MNYAPRRYNTAPPVAVPASWRIRARLAYLRLRWRLAFWWLDHRPARRAELAELWEVIDDLQAEVRDLWNEAER